LVNKVLNVMKAVAKTGIAMIVVIHEMSFAGDVADNAVFIADGRIVEQGPPDTVLNNPKEERTREFLSRVR